ncbi:MAG: V-type ATP synthase subunit E [Clostridia bacterium]|nr:V-type ATP synthase subunit E [Clostridia bacterium]
MSMNGLDRITEKILAEARDEAAGILAAAEAECERITADYAARADAIRERLNAEAEREATDLIARAKSTAATQKRNTMLMAQSELLDEVFEGALTGIRNLDTEKYTETLIGLLCAALIEQDTAEKTSRTLYGEEDAMAPAAYEVLLNQRDRDRCGQVLIAGAKQKLGGKLPSEMLEKLTLSDKTAAIDGGLILRCGSIESNCSLRLLFAQLREELETEVSRALFGTADRP